MNRPVEWIKTVVGLCIREFTSEKDRMESFVKMEKEYGQFTETEKKSIRNIMMNKFEVKDMIFVLSVIVQYMEIKDFREDLMTNILKGNFDCFTGSMLGYQALTYVKGEYRGKRFLYRRNMEKFKQVLDVNYPYLPIEKRNKNRIVIVVGQLLKIEHSPTKVILDIAYVLQEILGYEILFFVCPCNANSIPVDLWYKWKFENTRKVLSEGTMKITYRNAVFHGYQIDMESKNLKEYSMMHLLIYAYNPIFVLDASTANPVVGVAGEFTTLVSLPMTVGCPVSEGEILIRYTSINVELEAEYAELLGSRQTQLFLQENFPILVEESQMNYTRAGLGLPEGKFLVTIVGNRLKTDINYEFVQVMKAILEKAPSVVFVMIGENQIGEYFEDEVFKGHIYDLGHCNDLMGVYQVLDLYLNPQRMGGGFSGGMALQAGVPVVTLPYCDVYDTVSICGEAFVVYSYDEMIDVVCRYASDQDFYQRKIECIKMFKEKTGETQLIRWVKELLEGIIGIMEKENK